MPAKQRGSVLKRGTSWQARWYDEQGVAHAQGGFETKTAAGDWLESKVNEVSALRRGDLSALRRQDMPTLRARRRVPRAAHRGGEHPPHPQRAVEVRNREVRRHARRPSRRRRDRRVANDAAERSAWAIHKCLRQVLHYAVRVKIVDENVAVLVPNPERKRREIPTFESVSELEAIGEELEAKFAPIPVLVGLTGLRPEEWLALEHRDIDRKAGVVHVRRPAAPGAAEALATLPTGIGSALVFQGEPWRACEPPRMATGRLDACRQSGGTRPPWPLRAPAHLCELRNRSRRLAVRARPLQGCERRAD